jgi:hypothetical protein
LRQLVLEHFDEEHFLYDGEQLASLVGGLEVLGITSRESAWVQLLVKMLRGAAEGCGEEEAEIVQGLIARAECLVVPVPA